MGFRTAPPTSADAGRFAVRRLDRPHLTVRPVDGGWWPGTRDLCTEACALVLDAARAGFTVGRIEFFADAWLPSRTKRLTVAGTRVRFEARLDHEPDMITLVTAAGWDRIRIVVVPPQTPGTVATCALGLAADHARADGSGTQVLEEAYARAVTAVPDA